MRRAAAIWLALLACACAERPPRAPSSMQGFAADYGRWLAEDSPELAFLALPGEGEEARAWRETLDQRSALSVDLRRTAVLRGLVRLEALDPAALSTEDQRLHRLLLAHFSSLAPGAALEGGRFSPIEGFRPYVLDPFRGAFVSLPRYLSGQHAIRDLDDADAYIARLRRVAPAIREETARARADAANGLIPPAALLVRALQQVEPIASGAAAGAPFAASLRLRLEALLGPIPATAEGEETPALRRARPLLARAEEITAREIAPAYREIAVLIRSLLDKPEPEPDRARSKAWRAAGLAYVAGGAVDAPAAERDAQGRVQELSRLLDSALRALGRVDGPPAARLAAMAAEPRYTLQALDSAALAAALKLRMGAALQLASGWFSGQGPAPVTVRAPLGASGRLLSYEPPRKPGEAAVILVGAELARLPSYELATLMHHEGVPGHHAQASLAAPGERPSALRLIHFPAYAEGWATYAEQLAEEFGVFQNRPEERVGFLHWQLVRAARLVVDAGLHEHGWTRQQGLDYFARTTGLAPALAVEEIDRILAAPGWASAYELGRRRLSEARARAQLALGPDFDVRLFHQTVLGDGELPLDLVDARVNDWIQGVQAGTAKAPARRAAS